MSAYIKQLLDKDDNPVYPVAKASATYMDNTEYTVQEVIDDMADGSTKIAFKTTGDIEKVLASGNKVETVFSEGKITETTYAKTGDTIQVKETVFNADGSIDITITKGGK